MFLCFCNGFLQSTVLYTCVAIKPVENIMFDNASNSLVSLYNFTSAQDRRTLSTAQSCLNSLRIRMEAQVNTVEEIFKQRQLPLSLELRKETSDLPLPLREHQRVAIIFPFSKRAQMHTPLIRLVLAVHPPNSEQDPDEGVFQCRTLPSDQVILLDGSTYWGGPNLRLQFFLSLRAQK